MFNHSQRVRKIAMSFLFKRKLSRSLFGFGAGTRFGRHGCRHGVGPTPEQSAEQRDWIVNRVADKLSLNAEQKPLLAALFDQVNAQRHAMVGSTTDPRAELRSWFAGARFEAERAQALINDKVDKLQTQSPAVLARLAAFYDSLNPAQQQRVRDVMDGGRRGWFRRC
jgi:Spy/CpxP family protein refolding chaperone